MGEDLAWASEAARGQRLSLLRSLLLFQGLHEDVLDAACE